MTTVLEAHLDSLHSAALCDSTSLTSGPETVTCLPGAKLLIIEIDKEGGAAIQGTGSARRGEATRLGPAHSDTSGVRPNCFHHASSQLHGAG